MKLIQKGNKQLRVDELALKTMLENGYEEIDEKTGKPLNTSEKDEKEALKKENAALRKENKALKGKVAELSKPPAENGEKE